MQLQDSLTHFTAPKGGRYQFNPPAPDTHPEILDILDQEPDYQSLDLNAEVSAEEQNNLFEMIRLSKGRVGSENRMAFNTKIEKQLLSKESGPQSKIPWVEHMVCPKPDSGEKHNFELMLRHMWKTLSPNQNYI